MISPERSVSNGGDVPACDRAAIIGEGEADDWDRWARIVEKRFGCGQVDELIEEAREELTFVGKMIGSLHSSSVPHLQLKKRFTFCTVKVYRHLCYFTSVL